MPVSRLTSGVRLTYDAANRLQSLNLPCQGALTWSQYTPGGQPGRLTLPGEHRIDYTYDMVQRPVQITAQTVAGTQLMTRGYAFNNAGNIDQQTKDGVPLTYGYDALNQLTQTPEGAIAYDPMGNRQNNPGTTAPWTVNALNQVTHDGVQSYGYNANGSLTLATSASLARTFSYNPEGRLSNVSQNGQSVASYLYDVFNRRVKKVVAPAQGTVMPTVTYYLYSDEGLLAEYDESGNEQRAYGWKPHGTWGTDPIWMKEGAQTAYYLNDHLGTPQKMVSATGQTVWSASYDTFGRATVELGAFIANGVKQSIGGSDLENNLRFPGQYFDAETGWHYNWHRYYVPDLGRYNRLDPIKDDRNWYGYVANSPINYIDPLGESLAGAVGGWIAGDAAIPEPTDAAWPKWAGYAAAFAIAVGIDAIIDKCNKPRCLPCIPPVGSKAYRIDYPPSPPHRGIPTPHSHEYEMHQSPPSAGCVCFWKKVGKDPLPGVHGPPITPAGGGGIAP